MALRKTANIIHRSSLSSRLQIVRIMPEEGDEFPAYKAGQHIALSRENCKLTKKIVDEQGEKSYIYDLDENGNPKRGIVTHSYSIASAPFETRQSGYLEFYIALEMMRDGQMGRLTESLFLSESEFDEKLQYVDRIVGDFTFEKRAADVQNVLMVGTGTGVAPFVSMLKQLHYETRKGIHHNTVLTLIHTNRSVQELAYHTELQAIEASKKLNFVYLPTVSRPANEDRADSSLGMGRANNLLRFLVDLPTKEEQDLEEAKENNRDTSRVEAILRKKVMPSLPLRYPKQSILERIHPANTVVMTCGNQLLMDDVQYIASKKGFKFEKEEW